MVGTGTGARARAGRLGDEPGRRAGRGRGRGSPFGRTGVARCPQWPRDSRTGTDGSRTMGPSARRDHRVRRAVTRRGHTQRRRTLTVQARPCDPMRDARTGPARGSRALPKTHRSVWCGGPRDGEGPSRLCRSGSGSSSRGRGDLPTVASTRPRSGGRPAAYRSRDHVDRSGAWATAAVRAVRARSGLRSGPAGCRPAAHARPGADAAHAVGVSSTDPWFSPHALRGSARALRYRSREGLSPEPAHPPSASGESCTSRASR
jgi:hypothetical protein